MCAPFGKLYFHFYNTVYIKFIRTELKNLIQPYHYYISLVLIFLRAGLNYFFTQVMVRQPKKGRIKENKVSERQLFTFQEASMSHSVCNGNN